MENHWRYCAKCGSPLTTKFIAGRKRPICASCSFIVYHNPVPVGLIVATHQGKLLLIRRAMEPLKGYWAPPSGYVEYDETVKEALIREVKEETSLEVTVDGLLDVYSRANTGILFIAYYGRVLGGKPIAGEEADEVGFFAPDQLPSQPVLKEGSELDRWFLEVISAVMEVIIARVRGGQRS